jgi:glycogen operon protein
MPKSKVIDSAFTWVRDRAPRIPWGQTIFYETHVKGFTQLHPSVPAESSRHFRWPGAPEIVDYIKSLGVSAVELLPIHSFVNDSYLLDKQLTNYWG